jgi:hypothetical protein
MSFSPIDEYIANTEEGFARSYLFRVYLTFPSSIHNNMTRTSCYAKATNLPDVATEEISSYFMGLQNKMSSVRRYPDWQLTMYVDKSTSLLEDFYRWNALCHNIENNHYGKPSDYMVRSGGSQVVHLLDSKRPDNKPVMIYKFIGAWPKAITNVTLEYESNQYLTMDINLSYQYFTISRVVNTDVADTAEQQDADFGTAGMREIDRVTAIAEESYSGNTTPAVYSTDD